jgi:hypothetical protein
VTEPPVRYGQSAVWPSRAWPQSTKSPAIKVGAAVAGQTVRRDDHELLCQSECAWRLALHEQTTPPE